MDSLRGHVDPLIITTNAHAATLMRSQVFSYLYTVITRSTVNENLKKTISIRESSLLEGDQTE
jgi:hypothetical protein